MGWARVLLTVTLGVALAACGQKANGVLDDGGPGDGNHPDSPSSNIDAGIDAPPGPCDPPNVQCGSTCSDPSHDNNHCGNCATSCPGTESCQTGLCCPLGDVNVSGLCCPGGWINSGGICCLPGQTNSNGVCCGAGLVNTGGICCMPGEIDAGGICCAAGEINSNGICCAAGQTECGGFCINTQSDNNNCGACNTVCGNLTTCDSGLCCPDLDLNCGGTCINPASDNNNCGGCGGMCLGLTTCSLGTCVSSCNAPNLDCGGSCIDPNTNDNNCGGCAGSGGTTCGAGQSCLSGVCCASGQVNIGGICCLPGQTNSGGICCNAGQANCGGTCVNEQTDNNHCGGCATSCSGTASCLSGLCCPAGEVNLGGLCCPAGDANCAGACVNEQTSNSNCGACGTTCLNGKVCAGGSCVCSGPASLCNGTCVNEQTDNNNCGSCNTVCPSGSSCSSGACCPSGQVYTSGICCPVGSSNCNGTCVNEQTDSNHCGSCANKCPSTELCNGAGVCGLSCGTTAVAGATEAGTTATFTTTTAHGLAIGFVVTVAGVAVAGYDGTWSVTSVPSATTFTATLPVSGLAASAGGTVADLTACPTDTPPVCANLNDDSQNCGTCGHVCVGGEQCDVTTAGVCACPPSNPDLCAASCTNTTNDPSNCGVCGTTCPAGDHCDLGSCCGFGLSSCGGTCKNEQTDPNNCGTCGTACAAVQTCTNGTCSCPFSDETLCGAACVVESNDPNNCGACGNVCGVGANAGKPNCVGGTCGCTPRTCAQAGATCGQVADGCGGLTPDCGACPVGFACGVGGVPNTCGSTCTGPLCGQVNACGGLPQTTITGTVTAPGHNNTATWGTPDPIYGAFVYIPNGAAGPPTYGVTAFTPGVACDSCASLISGSPMVSATTGIDGKFTLTNAPCGSNIPLVIQLGRWRRQIVIPTVTCCNTAAQNVLTNTQTHLPRDHVGEVGPPADVRSDIPLMAFSTGSADSLHCVLRKIGIADSEFTDPSGTGRVHFYQDNGAKIDGTTPAASTLYTSAAELAKYDMTLFECVGGPQAKPLADQNLVINYANAGGRVYASHYSYVWLTNDTDSLASNTAPAPWFQTATWDTEQASADTANGFVDTTLQGDAATQTRRTAFEHWLFQPAVGASTTLGEIPVVVVRHDFNSVSGAAATMAGTPAQQWLYSNGTGFTNGGPWSAPLHYTFDTPIAYAPNPAPTTQCGRVLYSDFHVSAASGAGTFPSECGGTTPNPATMNAQEKTLEFMLFDLASCVGPPIPTCTPKTCTQLGYSCGPSGDGCADGVTLNCGTCAAPLTCGGGGSVGTCGCTPLSCAAIGATCGLNSDGCSGTVNCGTCPAGESCVGGAVPNHCVPM